MPQLQRLLVRARQQELDLFLHDIGGGAHQVDCLSQGNAARKSAGRGVEDRFEGEDRTADPAHETVDSLPGQYVDPGTGLGIKLCEPCMTVLESRQGGGVHSRRGGT